MMLLLLKLLLLLLKFVLKLVKAGVGVPTTTGFIVAENCWKLENPLTASAGADVVVVVVVDEGDKFCSWLKLSRGDAEAAISDGLTTLGSLVEITLGSGNFLVFMVGLNCSGTWGANGRKGLVWNWRGLELSWN